MATRPKGSGLRVARKALVVGVIAAWLVAVAAAGVAHAAAPTLRVDPRSGTVGSSVRVTGRGFCGTAGCSSVQLSVAGIVVADGIQVGPDRTFSLIVTVPGGLQPGQKAVAATQTTSANQQRVAVTTFTVQGPRVGSPTPSLTATSPPPATSAPSATGSPAAGTGNSSSLTTGMWAALAVFLAAMLGIALVLWRSRETFPPTARRGPPHQHGPPAEHGPPAGDGGGAARAGDDRTTG